MNTKMVKLHITSTVGVVSGSTPHRFGNKVNIIFTVYEPHTARYFANIAHTPFFLYTIINNLDYTFCMQWL